MHPKTNVLLIILFTLCAWLPLKGAVFAKGADISWVTQMTASGRIFRDDNNQQKDLIDILKNHGMNTIRLRVWVNPSNGYNNKADVVAKAVKAKGKGMRVLIDFHYSDTWADPAHQTLPSAWSSYTFNGVMDAVWWHTRDVLTALKNAGVTPEWVQVGNETNDGICWPHGRASSNMRNYAWIVNTGYDATKSIFPSAKVIVHLANGYDNALYRWNIGGLVSNGAKFDVVGLSVYPDQGNWRTINSQVLTNMNDMVTRYGKEVMVVECGFPQNRASDAKAFIADLLGKTRSVSQGKGLGVLYWEPQAYNWQGYPFSAWDPDNTPTIALDAFLQ